MNTKLALEKVHDIVLGIKDEDTKERLISYSVISTIMRSLDKFAEENNTPNYEIYKHELLWSCEALAGLDIGNNHEDSNHITWALSAIQKLESIHCFNVNNQRIPE